jgi:hypothetical protein
MRLTPRSALRSTLHAARSALLGAVTLGLITAASAQGIEAIPESVLRPYSLRDIGAPPSGEPSARGAAASTTSEPQLRDCSMLGGAVQLEAPRLGINGSYSRPRIIIGVPSESMRGLLNAAGVPAEQCLLPMLKARARLNADGEASGAMWLYARCTFQ